MIIRGRWLFYIEGALTIFFAIVALFILPDFPATSAWLSPLERRLAEKRLEEDVGATDKDQKEKGNHMEGLLLAISDWKVWWLALALTSMVISLSFNAFFPTLAQTMGFNTTITLLLCAPPWVFATACAFLVTRYVNKQSHIYFITHYWLHLDIQMLPANGFITSFARFLSGSLGSLSR
jgi:hypothetical protein